MTMDELKPCPFCGGEACFTINGLKKRIYCYCWVCGARGFSISYQDKPDQSQIKAVKREWNRRTNNG